MKRYTTIISGLFLSMLGLSAYGNPEEGYLSVRANLIDKHNGGNGMVPRGLCHAVNILGEEVIYSTGTAPTLLVPAEIAAECSTLHGIVINPSLVDNEPKAR